MAEMNLSQHEPKFKNLGPSIWAQVIACVAELGSG